MTWNLNFIVYFLELFLILNKSCAWLFTSLGRVNTWLQNYLLHLSLDVLITPYIFLRIGNEDLSSAVHTGVEVCRMDSEMSRLVEWPWLQLMCCCVVTTSDDRKKFEMGVSVDLVCYHWILEIEFNKNYLHQLSD